MWKKCSSGPRDYDSVLSDEDDVDLSDEEPQEPSGSTVLAGVEVCVDFPGLGEQTLAFETLSRFTSGLTAAGADYSVSPDGSLAIRDGGLNVVTTSISSYYIFLSASENAERNWDEIVGLKSGQSVEYYVSGRGSADDAIFVRPSAAVAYLLTAMGMSPGGAISREGHIGPKCDIFRIHPSPSVPDYSRALHLIRSIDHDRVSGRAIFSNQHKLDSNASYGVEEFGGFDADASVQMAIGGATFSAEEFIQLSDLRGMAANCSLDFPAMGPQAETVDDHRGGRIDWDGHSRVLCVAVTIDSLVTATDRCLADLGSGEKLCYTFAHGSRSAVYAWPMGAAAVTLRDAIMAKWVSFKGAPDGTVTRVHRVGRGRDYYNVSSENTPGATAVAELLREKFPRRRITVNGTVFSKGA
jgi:hypothetical protein